MEGTYYVDIVFDDHSYPNDDENVEKEEREALLKDYADAIRSVTKKFNDQHPDHHIENELWAYTNRRLCIKNYGSV